MKIFKYTLGTPGASGVLALSLPKGAKLLTVQMQGDVPQLWALVDPEKPKEIRSLRVIPTGIEVGQVSSYLGTFQIRNKSPSEKGCDIYIPPEARGPATMVFHVFEDER